MTAVFRCAALTCAAALHLDPRATCPYNLGGSRAMSYRTFKRVLGETNLERKCRWWFGISLVVMLSLSFTWYGRQTDKLVEKSIQTLSQECVRAGWQNAAHREAGRASKASGSGPSSRSISTFYRRSWRRAASNWARAFNGTRSCRPTADWRVAPMQLEDTCRDDEEQRLLAAMGRASRRNPRRAEGDEARAGTAATRRPPHSKSTGARSISTSSRCTPPANSASPVIRAFGEVAESAICKKAT